MNTDCCTLYLICFNPRARDGREDGSKLLFGNDAVSIHAPVMDAKVASYTSSPTFSVSIHAPVMDANVVIGLLWLIYQFQSTRP